MTRHYTIDELLTLRESPLVSKPDGLLPVEEWIGTPQERTERTAVKPMLSRARTDDPHSGPSRSSLPVDIRHGSRGSNPITGDIVLGPPKTAFPSSFSSKSPAHKASDSTDRTGFPFPDDRTERGLNRDRTTRGPARFDREAESPRDFRSAAGAGRKGLREEADGWTSVRSRKSFGTEDGERMNRRTFDRERERDGGFTRDGRDRPTRNHESYVREKTDGDGGREFPPRRDGNTRARTDGSWFRSDDAPTPRERDDVGRNEPRERGWRSRNNAGDRFADRDWSRDQKVEKDPEWMDAPVSDEKQEVHTAEDFQRWKERMKAGNMPADEKPEEIVKEDATPLSPSLKQDEKRQTPIVMDTGVDKFFSLWNEPQKQEAVAAAAAAASTEAEASSRKVSSRGPSGKASRFTSFFNPHEPAPEPMPEPQATPQAFDPSQGSSSADKEGFQRILQMLGGAGGPGPDSQDAKPPQNDLTQLFSSTNLSSSDKRRSGHQNEPRNAGSRSSTAVENTTGRAAPSSKPPSNRNSEFLFSLMQQANVPNSDHSAPEGLPPGLGGESQGTQRRQARGGDKNEPQSSANQRPPPGFFDDLSSGNYPKQPLHKQTPSQGQSSQARFEGPPGFPPTPNSNVPRPPGFEHGQPPGWPTSPFIRQDMPGPPPPPGLEANPPNGNNHAGTPNQGGRMPMFPAFGGGPPGLPGPLPPPGLFPPGGPSGPGRPGPAGPAPGQPGTGIPPPPPGFYGPPPPGYPPLPFPMDMNIPGGMPHPGSRQGNDGNRFPPGGGDRGGHPMGREGQPPHPGIAQSGQYRQ